MTFLKRYTVFVAIITALSVANAASKESKKSISFELSQAAAVVPIGCLGCLEMRARQDMRNLYSLRAIPTSVVSADPDPDPAKRKDPRTKVVPNNPIEIQKLAIGLVNVTVGSDEPQPDVSGSERPPRKSSNGMYYGEGSAVAVSRCVIATNHHVGFAGYNEAAVKKVKIDFIRTTKGSDGSLVPHLVKSSGVVIADSGYQGRGDKAHKDILFIRVDRSIPDGEIMPPCFATTSESRLIPVGSAPYFKDETTPDGSILWEQKKCKILGGMESDPIDEKLWATNCPALPGVSGSPIYAKLPSTGKLCALGIMQGMMTNNIKISQDREKLEHNKMLPFSQVISRQKLKEIIDSVDCDNPIDPIKPPKRIMI